MKKRQLSLICALAAVILAVGVSPSMAWDYKGHASPSVAPVTFPVYAATDDYAEVVFTWDAPCTLMVQVKDADSGAVLGTVDLNNGAFISLTGGGTFSISVWSTSGSCNWEATIAGLFAGGPYTGRAGGPNGEGLAGGGTTTGGGTTGGGGNCGDAAISRKTFAAPGVEMLSIWITPDCTPAFVCFTVNPGRTCSIVDSGIISAGNNCATGVYIDDPGIVVARGCCTDDIIYTFQRNPKGGGALKSGTNSFGPGTYTLMPAGGRNFTANVSFSVQ